MIRNNTIAEAVEATAQWHAERDQRRAQELEVLKTLEPDAHMFAIDHMLDGAVQVSVAISLKRLADFFCGPTTPVTAESKKEETFTDEELVDMNDPTKVFLRRNAL